MHDGRIELDHTVSIRQAAVADAVIEWVELDDVDACNDCVENVRTGSDHLKSFLNGSDVAAVFEAVAVGRRENHRLDGAWRQDRRKGWKHDARGSAVTNEIATFHFAHVVLVLLEWNHRLTRMTAIMKVLL